MSANDNIYLITSGEVIIAGERIPTFIQWNTQTGEARMISNATVTDRNTGKTGNLVGWVPIVDMETAMQNFNQAIRAQS